VWQKFFETVVVAKERTLQPKPRIPAVMCTDDVQNYFEILKSRLRRKIFLDKTMARIQLVLANEYI